ncbi:hypothetical protein C8N24_6420 [Solirubrobacter pauli]|uniref:Uncharacterized protein n=1 Tax=Solirubrobacter pauli TaxID=166793 RepID=A0A660L0K3_9ACTN|nr:hypothetical protein C8N24_6420 [Solirubrobacter pauli]
MVFVADIDVEEGERVAYACPHPAVAVQRAADEYEDWATTRARRLDPGAPHVAFLPISASAAARRAKWLRTLDPSQAFSFGRVTVDPNGFRVEFRRIDDVTDLDRDARQALV